MTQALSSEELSFPTVQIHCWDDQCVAFHLRSGDTHLLGILAGRVLLCASAGTTGLSALAEETAHAMGIDPDDEFVAMMESIVIELQTKGLLSHSCCSPN